MSTHYRTPSKPKAIHWPKLIIISALVATVIFFLAQAIIASQNQISHFWVQGYKNNINWLIGKTLTSDEDIEDNNSINYYRAQILDLQGQLEVLETENTLLQTQLNKIQELESILNLKQSQFPEAIAANIIQRSPDSWHKQITIDKGKKNGLEIGMVVVSEKGIIGKIHTVNRNYSIVNLIGSRQMKFGAEIKRTGAMGIINASNKKGEALLKFIPIGSDIKEGDIVQTSSLKIQGLNSVFPAAFPVGEVIEVSNDKSNTQMKITIKLFEDNSKIKNTLVLKN